MLVVNVSFWIGMASSVGTSFCRLGTTDLMSSLVQSFTAHYHQGLHPSPVSGSQDDGYDCPLGDVPWTDVRCAVINFHPDLVTSVAPVSGSHPCKEALESFSLKPSTNVEEEK